MSRTAAGQPIASMTGGFDIACHIVSKTHCLDQVASENGDMRRVLMTCSAALQNLASEAKLRQKGGSPGNGKVLGLH